jgi:Mn-dependent DtxR family transcriptional regulator
MDLQDTQTLLCGKVEDFLMSLYRLSKITDAPQINFLAGGSGVSAREAHRIADDLQRMGLVRFGKYGTVTWTKAGKEYASALAKRKEICYTMRG